MWNDMMRRWFELVFWWLPRGQREARPEAEPASRSPAPGAATRPQTTAAPAEAEAPAEPSPPPEAAPPQPAPAPPPAATEPDDLTVIKGIGPAMQKKLHDQGIATFAALAAADSEAVARGVGSRLVTAATVAGWIAQAREQVGTR